MRVRSLADRPEWPGPDEVRGPRAAIPCDTHNMPKAHVSDHIEIEYETFGSAEDPTLLLVMGFGAQLLAWDAGFCQKLAGHGRHVVRYDNRDVGLSTKLQGQLVDTGAILAASRSGEELPPVPYTLSEMAADGIGLLNHLGVEKAQVAGASMGGMIVQTMAIEHPERLTTVTSIMSTVGDQAYGAASPEALAVLLAPPPATREEAVDRAHTAAVYSSKRHFDPDRSRALTGASFDRSHYPEGPSRHLAAIFASGDRSDALRQLTVPMLVVHGLDDTLINPSGGRRTAELVPGAHLLEVADMGHDLPRQLWPFLISSVVGFDNAYRAS